MIDHTDPLDSDTDDDGMSDGWEAQYGLNPLLNDASADPDGDGLTNAQEYQYGTNPFDGDTDGDTLPDAWEISNGLDPITSAGRLQNVTIQRAGEFTAISKAQGVVCANGLAYLANGTDGLAIIDISSSTLII